MFSISLVKLFLNLLIFILFDGSKNIKLWKAPPQKCFHKICRVENNEQCLYAETINHIMVYFLYLVRMAVFYALKLESSAEDMLIL